MRSWRSRLIFGLAVFLGCLWMIGKAGIHRESILYCLCIPILLKIGILDETTGEIPPVLNLAVGGLGLARLLMDPLCRQEYLAGALAVSGILLALYWAGQGEGIGGGDIKLMAAAGFFLGPEKALLALWLASISALTIHLLRMKCFRKGRILAFGPYLCAGIFITMLYGGEVVQRYF